MGDHKRLSGKFDWLPPEQRPGRIPGPLPPRKPETRKPLYFLIPDNNELYFVNYSDDVLAAVSSTAGGMYTDDDCDELVPVSGPAYTYDAVQPKEAVKIEQYDPIADSDYIMQVTIIVLHPSSGENVFRAGGKGGISKEVVLLWDNGDLGKDVY